MNNVIDNGYRQRCLDISSHSKVKLTLRNSQFRLFTNRSVFRGKKEHEV
jgi:hypothetical protein